MGIAAGAAASTAAAATASAIRASGVIVHLEPDEFSKILAKSEKPLLVVAESGRWSVRYEYLTSYQGLAFYTKSHEPLSLHAGVEVVTCTKIWIP